MNSLLYKLLRLSIKPFCRPKYFGTLPEEENKHLVYVLPHRSLFDLACLDLLTAKHNLVSPSSINPNFSSYFKPRTLYLFRGSSLTKMRPNFSVELKDFLDLPKKDQSEIMFVPCTVFWGRAITFKKNRINLVSKHWSNPGLAKRLNNLLMNNCIP